MAAIVTNHLRIFNASKFKESLLDADTTKNIYAFIGKSDPWADDNTPDTTIDTVREINRVWYDMLSLKKVKEVDVNHAIPRYNWDASGNTKYIPYDHRDVDLYNHPTLAEIVAAQNDGTYTAGSFYVVTDQLNVYICLANTNNAKSTIKPTGTGTGIITTADGYKWKYLFTITASDILRFVTPSWIPVRTITQESDNPLQWAVQQAAVDGAIDIIKVENPGSGYTNVHSGTLVTGAIGGGTLPGTASAVDDAYNGATIYILTGTGAGQKRVISDYVGSSRVFTVSSNWTTEPDGTSTYEILPTITINGDGSGCEAKVEVSAGAIVGIDVTSAGSNYKIATASITGGGGSSAVVVPIIQPAGGHGKDPVKELGGFFCVIGLEFQYNEDDFPTANDYRRMGIVSNVRNFSDNQIATANTLTATQTLQLSSITGTFLPDEVINSTSGGTVSAKVVEFSPTGGGNGLLRIIQNENTTFTDFVPSQTLIGATSGAVATVSSITDPEVKKFVGNILWLENRRSLNRSPQQSEKFRVIIEF